MVMLYASYFPQRVDGIFLQSPAGIENEAAEDFVYDPYNLRITDVEDVNQPRAKVDEGIENYANNVHMFDGMKSMPFWLIKMGTKNNFRSMLKEEYFTDEMVEAAAEYYALMVQRLGRQDVVLQSTLKWFCFLKNTLHTPERMMQDFDFPIASCNGTRDFFGSTEGAAAIVKNNRFYEDGGRSQIFKIHNSGHNVFLDNPHQLTNYMIGFFNGTISGTFDLKPRKEFVADSGPDN